MKSKPVETRKKSLHVTTIVRPWGHMQLHASKTRYWIKTIVVKPGHRLSLQKHNHRSEVWVCVKGELTAEIAGRKKRLTPGVIVSFKPGVLHRLSSKKGGVIVEVAYGTHVAENDIIRIADDYSRASRNP